MTPFEYVTVLVSIILGLGITQIVTGVADLVHQWDRVKVYWPHLLWIIIVFFLQIQEWWSLYELRNITSLRLPTFFFVLLYPINLFFLARLLFPLTQPESVVDLKVFYFATYRKFFVWAIGLPVLSFIHNVLVTGHPLQEQVLPAILIVVFSIFITRKEIDERVHKVISVALLAVIVFALGILWNDAITAS